MLNTMRKYAAGWVAQILLGLLVLSFAVWGIADVFTGVSNHSVARVGGTDISSVNFDRAYRRELQAMSQRVGQQITPDQAKMLGIPNQVLGRLVTEAALDDQAKNLDIGVSREMLIREIAEDPAFRGAGGTFDRNYFVSLLRNNGMTEDAYVLERRAQEKRQQIAESISGGATAPQALAKALHEYQTEQRDIRYIALPASSVGEIAAPNADELTAYYNDNKADWRAPETRTIAFIKLGPDEVARPDDVSDADAQKAYDAEKARFTTPETRHVFQAVFTDESSAQTAADQLKAGESFESMLEGIGKKLGDSDLGVVTKDKLIDPKVAEAAFSLPANGSSDVIKGSFGPVVVHVTDITPETVKPFDAVKAEIKKELSLASAKADINVLRDSIEDARAGGGSLDEIATNNKLTVQKIVVDQTGKDAAGNAVAGIPAQEQLLKDAFASDVGIDNAAIPTEDGGYVWFTIADINEAHDRKLDEVKDKVIAAWKKQATTDKLIAKAKDAKDRLGKGETLDDVATSLGVTVQTLDKQTRSSRPTGAFSTEALKAAFAGPKGSVEVAPGAEDSEQIVLQVADVIETPYTPGVGDSSAVTQQLADAMQNDLLQQYVAELQRQLGVTVNQTVLQQIISAI
ncbi:SurA N-terminal domain-containing protein [Kaistia defluvii]|uniref:SurA N-terminal domain-containing protein n=1 Tax=Kaistia defluvii TaxID=410841 RepID=UPI00225BF818|nr:SurA N-terminal domain-containing protein [Kaistia defluvii]MCX5521085.1 SurA N-terminal domain-containing protein [Kaistia defluvii]